MKIITRKKGKKIIETLEPRGKFYYIDDKHNMFIAIDNSTGEAWQEEFNTENECINWLGGNF